MKRLIQLFNKSNYYKKVGCFREVPQQYFWKKRATEKIIINPLPVRTQSEQADMAM